MAVVIGVLLVKVPVQSHLGHPGERELFHVVMIQLMCDNPEPKYRPESPARETSHGNPSTLQEIHRAIVE